MQTIIKPSAVIRKNYSDISNLAKETGMPIFLTKGGEGDLVVMHYKKIFPKMNKILLLGNRYIII